MRFNVRSFIILTLILILQCTSKIDWNEYHLLPYNGIICSQIPLWYCLTRQQFIDGIHSLFIVVNRWVFMVGRYKFLFSNVSLKRSLGLLNTWPSWSFHHLSSFIYLITRTSFIQKLTYRLSKVWVLRHVEIRPNLLLI